MGYLCITTKWQEPLLTTVFIHFRRDTERTSFKNIEKGFCFIIYFTTTASRSENVNSPLNINLGLQQTTL